MSIAPPPRFLGDAPKAPFDVARVRQDFPILRQQVNGKPLVYLDNAATAQKPQCVIDAVARYYETINSNIHRGVHTLSMKATEAYEAARVAVQRFLNAREAREIIFVRGTTEAINLVAASYGRANVHAGDEVLITHMEHHSGIVPWQMLCAEKNARLRVCPITDDGDLMLDELERRLSPRTRIVSLVHVSNTLGSVNPVKQIVAMAHARGVPVLIDGAQAAPHLAVDVQDLDCDFYAFSGHKLYGPTGVGVLYGKARWLEAMPPWQGGGDMISSVTLEKTTYNVIPHKFEAGTPHVAGPIGLTVAIAYLNSLGLDAIGRYEHELLEYAVQRLQTIDGLRLIGSPRRRVGVVSFVLDGIHAHDIGTILDQEGIAVRTGHHCTQPLMDRFGVPATARAAPAFYNTFEEIDALVDGLAQVRAVLG